MKVLVIGRHSGQIPGIEIAEQLNLTLPATSEKCLAVLRDLVTKCEENGWALLFQAAPNQLVPTFVALAGEKPGVKIGLVVNKPGERLAGVTQTFPFTGEGQAELAADAVKFANPRAKTDLSTGNLSVTCDPPMAFDHSHIEWLW